MLSTEHSANFTFTSKDNLNSSEADDDACSSIEKWYQMIVLPREKTVQDACYCEIRCDRKATRHDTDKVELNWLWLSFSQQAACGFVLCEVHRRHSPVLKIHAEYQGYCFQTFRADLPPSSSAVVSHKNCSRTIGTLNINPLRSFETSDISNSAWSEVSSVVRIRTLLFWGVTRRRLVTIYRRFGTTYEFRLLELPTAHL
jgi:hypothetical protein